MKNNKYSVTLLDVLNDYMSKQTTFGSDYPESDRAVIYFLILVFQTAKDGNQ